MLETEQGLRNGPLQPNFTGLAYPQIPVTWRSLPAFCPAEVARSPTQDSKSWKFGLRIPFPPGLG